MKAVYETTLKLKVITFKSLNQILHVDKMVSQAWSHAV